MSDSSKPAYVASERITHRGSCHCGCVRFEVDAPAAIAVLDCNCSICRMTGYLHLVVPATHFRLLSGDEVLTEYRFNKRIAKHLFCRHCGVKAFYVPRSHPDGVSVNARCLGPGTVQSMRVMPFDDGNRESETAALAHLTRNQHDTPTAEGN